MEDEEYLLLYALLKVEIYRTHPKAKVTFTTDS